MSKKEVGGLIASPIEGCSTSKGPEPPSSFFWNPCLYDSKVFLHKNHFKTKQDKRSWKDVNGHLISHHGSCQNGWKWRKCLSCLTIYTVLCIVKTIEFESEIECFATIEFDHRIFQKPDVLETLAGIESDWVNFWHWVKIIWSHFRELFIPLLQNSSQKF